MCVDVGETSSSNCNRMTEADSRNAIRVRKPYIVTKQRERWTEEEHSKFLEALKKYGRAWRRIEEHIGSKSTVQIRSHAQKFFSKVVRESSNNVPGTVRSVEIPPPRPKRKPSHPYPRKLGHLPSKKGSFVAEQLWSFMPDQSFYEPESKSPTSVLTAFETDIIGTFASDMLKPQVTSSDRAATVKKTLSEQGTESKFSSTSAVCKDTQSTDPSAALSMQYTSNMAFDPEIQDPVSPKEAQSATRHLRSLKLFGRTFIASGLELHDKVLEHEESFYDCNNMDLEKQKHPEQDGRGGEGDPCMAYYCLPSHRNLMSSVQPDMVSPPSCWALYGGMPFGFSKPLNTRFARSELQSE